MKDKAKKKAKIFINKFRGRVEIQIDIEIWTAFFFSKGVSYF